jgi:sigma-E factor negative regulatory protein RseB
MARTAGQARASGAGTSARLAAAAVCAVALTASSVQAQPVGAGGVATARGAAPERSELQWLQAIQSAAQRLNYVGTIVYQQGGSVRTSRIVHYFDGSISHERMQMLDGKPREFIRRDAEVQCLYPDLRRVLVERRPDPDFPSLGGGAPSEILDRYAVRLGGVERVAGSDCRVILLEPRDSLRYGYRLCADLVSALLLKAQTLNERQEALEQMAFADLRVGERVDRAQLRPSWSIDGWKIERSDLQPADLARSGWQVPTPPGFRKLREVGRTMASGAVGSAGRKAMQAVYSDGLATLSVFIETDGGGAGGAPGETIHSYGATSGYTRLVNEARVTVIGEVPPETVRSVAQSVEFRAPR